MAEVKSEIKAEPEIEWTSFVSPTVDGQVQEVSLTDEEDLVAEYDVMLATDLTKDLFLLQYPLRTKDYPYEDSQLRAFRYKPRQKVVEMEYEREVDLRFYNQDAAKDFGYAGKDMLRSNTVPSRTNYALGVVKSGQLHLTPLLNILQLRPAMEYVDSAESLRMAVERSIDTDSQEDTDGQSETESEAKPTMVQVQIKKKESDRAAAARKSSYAHMRQLMEEEAFINIEMQTRDDPNAAEILSKLYCEAKRPIALNANPAEYMKVLNPNPDLADTPAKKT